MNTRKEQVEIIPLFPTPVVVINIGRDFTKDELQLFLKDIPMMKDKGRRMQNHGSVNLTLFDTFAEELTDIRNFCEYQFEQYIENIDGANPDIAGLRITQAWLNNNKPTEQHHLHYHPNSYLSGVLYIKCLPNDHINFENRSEGNYNNMRFQMEKINVWNSSGRTVNVIEGDLILFPSWMLHSVSRNETKNKERISLAFNTFPIGEMGKFDEVSQLFLQ
jgi:uncharacterized protein (TIGR02466 family)